MGLTIAGFRGIGWVSGLIRLATYSVALVGGKEVPGYSHIGILFTADMDVEVGGIVHCVKAGNVIEAWQGGVKLSASLGERHTPGTPVDLFEFKTPLTPAQERIAAQFLVSQIGKGYDYLNVLRFVPIVRFLFPKPSPSIWTRNHVFCSELALDGFADCGRALLDRCRAWQVPPRDVPRSPLLMFQKTVIT
jgi:uncharacterized protein YycO